MKKLIIAGLALLCGLELHGENPSYDRQRRGQITYADDQLFVKEGSIAASPASETFRVQCEQNHFVFSVASGSVQLGFSANATGTFKFMTVKAGESLALPLEVSSGTYCRVKPVSAAVSFRFFATGRTDYNLGNLR